MKSIKRIDKNGDEFWELPNGMSHREDGPAIIYADGGVVWCLRGSWYLSWYPNDSKYSFDMYCTILKAQYGKTEEDIMMLRMQYDIG